MNMYDLVKSSIRSLKANKMRAFLTMLGIIIGISSVIAMSAIGKGGQKTITGNLQSTGYGNFQVAVNTTSTDYVAEYDLTDKQVTEISKIDGVEAAAPKIQSMGQLSFPKYPGKNERGFLYVTTKDYEKIDPVQYLYGRAFIDSEYNSYEKLITIDSETAKDYYGSYEAAIGETIELQVGARDSASYKYKIIGVFQNPYIGLTSLFGGRFKPRVVRVPLKAYMTTSRTDTYSTVIAKAKDPEQLNQIISKVQSDLDTQAPAKIYEVSAATQNGASFDSILSTLNIFITFIAGISLLVGGVGVMNIMLVSVTERIREIGIRKAIGAQPKSILLQFLVEAVIISTLGGIIGLLVGVSFAYLVFLLIGIEPVFSTFIVILALVVSMLIGIVFGVAPARKAARMNPVDALRA